MTTTAINPSALGAPALSHSSVRMRRFLRIVIEALQASGRRRAVQELEALADLHASSNSSYAADLRAATLRLRDEA
jgi:hypothetical protein